MANKVEPKVPRKVAMEAQNALAKNRAIAAAAKKPRKPAVARAVGRAAQGDVEAIKRRGVLDTSLRMRQTAMQVNNVRAQQKVAELKAQHDLISNSETWRGAQFKDQRQDMLAQINDKIQDQFRDNPLMGAMAGGLFNYGVGRLAQALPAVLR